MLAAYDMYWLSCKWSHKDARKQDLKCSCWHLTCTNDTMTSLLVPSQKQTHNNLIRHWNPLNIIFRSPTTKGLPPLTSPVQHQNIKTPQKTNKSTNRPTNQIAGGYLHRVVSLAASPAPNQQLSITWIIWSSDGFSGDNSRVQSRATWPSFLYVGGLHVHTWLSTEATQNFKLENRPTEKHSQSNYVSCQKKVKHGHICENTWCFLNQSLSFLFVLRRPAQASFVEVYSRSFRLN